MSEQLTGLIVDWGGVLTTGLEPSMQAWAEVEGIDVSDFTAVMGKWFGPQEAAMSAINPVHLLERGELQVTDFEQQLAHGLSQRIQREVSADGLIDRMMSHFTHAHDMTALVRRARDANIKTALLSNSWGNTYPDHLFDGMFDAIVISGEVGMRKPDPQIFRYTLDQLNLAASDCVFVDDLRHNVDAAIGLGIVGVHHVDYTQTATELSAVFDHDLF